MAQTIKHSAMVPYSAREMYALVEDIGSYQEFLHWCNDSEVDSRERAGGEDVVTASLGILYHGVNKRFTTRNVHTPHNRIRMELVEGPFRELSGDWRFTSLGDRACKVEFELCFDFSNRLVASVVGPVFRRISDGQVDAFHARAEEIYGKRSLAAGTDVNNG